MTRGAVLYLNKALPRNLVLEDSSTDGHLCACLLTLVKMYVTFEFCVHFTKMA